MTSFHMKSLIRGGGGGGVIYSSVCATLISFSMTSTLVQTLVCKLLNKCSCQSQNWKSRNVVPLYGSTEKIWRSTYQRSDNLP